jgi:hypothetical protein
MIFKYHENHSCQDGFSWYFENRTIGSNSVLATENNGIIIQSRNGDQDDSFSCPKNRTI